MTNLTHVISLQRHAGAEIQFAEFVRHASRRYPQWTHSWLNPAGAMDPAVAAIIDDSLGTSASTKYRGPWKLPAWPRGVRVHHCRRIARRFGTDIVVVWNRAARSGFIVDAVGPDKVIHWEHGRAWHDGRERETRRYFRRVQSAIAVSTATQRVLQLRWEFTGDIQVCRNALRPSLLPPQAMCKQYPEGRPIRLGVAARLVPVKGVVVALHALRLLRHAGLDAELHIAGDGTERPALVALARNAGIDDRTFFRGNLTDMATFYRHIDCLVHTPLTEAFGLVGIEAAAIGCPVIAARVDGLPEAVEDRISGYCLPPTLPLSDYTSLGGMLDDIPSSVYDPSADAMRTPKVVAPSDVADCVQHLFSSARVYEAISVSASERVVKQFGFDRHVSRALEIIAKFGERNAA